jgi:signal transduction histidine kinase
MAHILLGIFLFLKIAANDTSVVNRMVREATQWMDSKPDTSRALAESALDLSRRLGYREGEAQALSRLGIARHLTGESSGMEDLNRALDLFEAEGNQVQYAWTLLNLANLLIDKGDFVAASEKLQDALALFERLNHHEGVAASLLNLGGMRASLDQLVEALELTERGLAIYNRLNHERGRSLALYRLGGLKIRLGQPAQAIPLLNESLQITQSREDYRTTGNILEALGLANEQLGMVETALIHYRASLRVRLRIQDRIEMIGSKKGIAKTLYRMGDVKSAKTYATEAYEEATQLSIPKQASEAARLLYEMYKATGDTKTSLRYLEEYQSIRDQLFSSEKATAIANLEAVATLRSREQQIELLENQRFLERMILVAAIGVLILTIGFVVYAMRERRRVIRLAEELQRVGIQKDRILSIVSHDVRGPLASLSSVIDLIDMDLLSQSDWKELKPSLIRQFNGTDETLQDLLTWAKSQFEGADPRIQSISLCDAVVVSEELLDVVARQKQVRIVNDVSPYATVMCDRSHLLAILRNLLVNAVKFSKSGQTVTIQDGITDGMRIVSVRDEGVGMSVERRDKLFDGAGHTTLGTSGESGSGLGLVFVRDLVQRNGGRISVESTEGKGSVFTVALPMG